MMLKDRVVIVSGAARGIGRAAATRLARDGAMLALLDVPEQIPEIPFIRSAPSSSSNTGPTVPRDGSGGVVPARGRARREVGRGRRHRCSDALRPHRRSRQQRRRGGPRGIPGARTGRVGVERRHRHQPVRYVARDAVRVRGHGAPAARQHRERRLDRLRGPHRSFSAYVASKHGVIGLTRTAALDLGPFGVRVNAVCPGSVRDDPGLEGRMLAAIGDALDLSTAEHEAVLMQNQPNNALVEADGVAEMVHWLLSDGARHVTGASLTVDGGYTCQYICLYRLSRPRGAGADGCGAGVRLFISRVRRRLFPPRGRPGPAGAAVALRLPRSPLRDHAPQPLLRGLRSRFGCGHRAAGAVRGLLRRRALRFDDASGTYQAPARDGPGRLPDACAIVLRSVALSFSDVDAVVLTASESLLDRAALEKIGRLRPRAATTSTRWSRRCGGICPRPVRRPATRLPCGARNPRLRGAAAGTCPKCRPLAPHPRHRGDRPRDRPAPSHRERVDRCQRRLRSVLRCPRRHPAHPAPRSREPAAGHGRRSAAAGRADRAEPPRAARSRARRAANRNRCMGACRVPVLGRRHAGLCAGRSGGVLPRDETRFPTCSPCRPKPTPVGRSSTRSPEPAVPTMKPRGCCCGTSRRCAAA